MLEMYLLMLPNPKLEFLPCAIRYTSALASSDELHPDPVVAEQEEIPMEECLVLQRLGRVVEVEHHLSWRWHLLARTRWSAARCWN